MEEPLETFKAAWRAMTTREKEKAAEWAMREAAKEIHAECTPPPSTPPE